MSETLPDTLRSNLDENPVFKEVWASNLEAEFEIIHRLVETHTFIAMDTEYPGIVIEKPKSKFIFRSPEYEYEKIRSNVDCLKILQLGLTFLDGEGNTSSELNPYTTWQFNFKYDIEEDRISENSRDFLIRNGIPFQRLKGEGIESNDFGRLMNSVIEKLGKKVTWITFHGAIDFAYLLKVLTNKKLPSTKNLFYNSLKVIFRAFYDVKYILERGFDIYGGLANIASNHGIEIVGTSHQAGSDSLTTARLFFAIKDEETNDNYFRGLHLLSK